MVPQQTIQLIFMIRLAGMHPSAGDQDPDASGQPRFNFDILYLVCNRLTAVSDVLSLALTCSMLTETAFQRRLRMSPAVNLWSGESVDSFHRFIFADEAARAPYIYGLKLPDRFDYHVGEHEPQYQIFDDHLVAILQAAVHVEYLSFPTGVSDRVFTAAADVATLRELRIDGEVYSEYMWKILASFRSPIRSLRIDAGYGSDGLLYASSLQNHFTNCAHTLEVLEVQDLFLDISPSSITTPFTALRSLKTGSISNFDDLGVLLRLFPNLDDTLVLDTLNERSDPASPEWSQETQKTHTWPRLDRVVCDTKAAFLMALQCPIRSMVITVVPSWQARQQRYDLAPILRHNCPRRLRLSASFNDGLGGLDELFPPEGTDNLTHLVMFADCEIRYGHYVLRGKRKLRLVAWNQFRVRQQFLDTNLPPPMLHHIAGQAGRLDKASTLDTPPPRLPLYRLPAPPRRPPSERPCAHGRRDGSSPPRHTFD